MCSKNSIDWISNSERNDRKKFAKTNKKNEKKRRKNFKTFFRKKVQKEAGIKFIKNKLASIYETVQQFAFKFKQQKKHNYYLLVH